MTNDKFVKVGIIGVGTIGSAHAASIYNGAIDGMRLCALCDTSEERANALKELYPDVPIYTSDDEFFEKADVEAIIIATPHYDHPPLAIRGFENGLHVLTEKPAGVYCSAARAMSAAAKKSGKVFGIMFNQRTNKLFKEARRIVRSGELGELKRSVWIITNWYRKQCYYDSGDWRATWSGEGGGVLMNQAPHNLDLWQWICGMPVSLRAECKVAHYHNIEVEDDATIFAEYENGASGVFITSTGDFPGTNRLEITGTKGKLVLESKKLTHWSFAMDEREYCLSDSSTENEITVSELTDEKYNGHHNILKNFARTILYGDELIAKGEDAINELTLCNAAYLSSWTDKKVTLPFSDEEYETLLKEKIASSHKKTVSHSGKATLNDYYVRRWNTNW